MTKGPRVENAALLEAGLELMRRRGKPLVRLPGRGRAMLYRAPDGSTVRVRTCNDHILIAVADSPKEGAKLNIEGTDWILIVMPAVERMSGEVIAYLVPTVEAVKAVRFTHNAWLASNPNTQGGNTTWNLWFSPDGPAKACGFSKKWEVYKLPETINVAHPATQATQGSEDVDKNGPPYISAQDSVWPLSMADAKRALAAFYNVTLESIEIMIRG